MAIKLDLTKFEGVGENKPKKEESAIDVGIDVGQKIGNTLTFGQAPHIAGFYDALGGAIYNKLHGQENSINEFTQDYKNAREKFKKDQKEFEEEHPKLALTGDVVGAIGTLPVGGAVAKTPRIAQLLKSANALEKGALAGASWGGAYGLGQGASNTEGKAFDAVGSAVGATAGAVGGAALGGLGQLARRLFLSKNTGRVGDYIRPEGIQEHSMQHILNDKEVAREVAKGGIGKRMSEFTGEAQKSFDNAKNTIDSAIKQAYEGIDDKSKIGIDKDYIQNIINRVEKNVGSDRESQKILKEAKLILQDIDNFNKPTTNRAKFINQAKSFDTKEYKGLTKEYFDDYNGTIDRLREKEWNRLVDENLENIAYEQMEKDASLEYRDLIDDLGNIKKAQRLADTQIDSNPEFAYKEAKDLIQYQKADDLGNLIKDVLKANGIKNTSVTKEAQTGSRYFNFNPKGKKTYQFRISDHPEGVREYQNDLNFDTNKSFVENINSLFDFMNKNNIDNSGIPLDKLKNLKDRVYRLKNSAYKTEPTGDTKRLVSQDIVDMLDNMYSSLSNAEKRHSPQLKYANEFYSDMKNLNEEVAKINPKGLYDEAAIARAATRQNKDVSGDVFQLAEGNIRKILDKYPQVKNIDKFLTDLKKVQVSSNIKPDENYATSFTIRKIIDHFIKGGSRDQRMQMFAQAVKDGKITKDMLNQEFRKARNIPILTDIINYHLAANKVPSINNLSNIISKSSKANPYLERYVLPRITIKEILDRYYNKEQ